MQPFDGQKHSGGRRKQEKEWEVNADRFRQHARSWRDICFKDLMTFISSLRFNAGKEEGGGGANTSFGLLQLLSRPNSAP